MWGVSRAVLRFAVVNREPETHGKGYLAMRTAAAVAQEARKQVTGADNIRSSENVAICQNAR